jgi:hypothetical protein
MENIFNPKLTMTAEEAKECNDQSQFFLQVPCEIDSSYVESRDRV